MSQNSALRSIKKLENYKFFIPSYQRGYRWGDREVDALLEDIWDFALKQDSTQNAKDSFYCLQPIVVKQNSKQYNIIDGQQRLTTIFLIVKFLDKNKNLFTLEYQTRSKSADFLQNIDQNTKEQSSNIDFFHFSNAYKIITNSLKIKG